MKKCTWKRILSLGLCAGMILSVAAYGEKKEAEDKADQVIEDTHDGEDAETDANAGDAAAGNEMAELYANIPHEIPDLSGYTISIMSPPHFDGSLFDEILPYYQQVEELTGVTLKWESVASEYESALETRLLSDNAPDIFLATWSHSGLGLIDSYIQDGVLYELSQAFDVAPNMKAFYEEKQPSYTEKFAYTDGGIYTIPTSRYDSDEGYMSNKLNEETLVYRADIAEELGFTETPTTIEDWYELLTAVKQAYPDMIPFNCSEVFKYAVDDLGTFGSAWGIQSNLCVFNKFILGDDGKVQLQAVNDEMKAFVTEMNKWYEEGLIGFTAGGDNRISLPLSGAVFSCMYDATHVFHPAIDALRESDPDALFLAAPYPTLDGYETTFMGRNMYEGIVCITDNGDDQARAAMQLMDFMYFSDFAAYSNLMGTMGPDTWYFDENGEVVVVKEHATNLFMETINLFEQGCNMWCLMPSLNYGIQTVNDDMQTWYDEYMSEGDAEYIQVRESQIAATEVNYEHLTAGFPDGFMEASDMETYNLLMTPLETYVTETISGMIMGNVDIDTWDSYVDECYDVYQLQTILDIQQKYHG